MSEYKADKTGSRYRPEIGDYVCRIDSERYEAVGGLALASFTAVWGEVQNRLSLPSGTVAVHIKPFAWTGVRYDSARNLAVPRRESGPGFGGMGETHRVGTRFIGEDRGVLSEYRFIVPRTLSNMVSTHVGKDPSAAYLIKIGSAGSELSLDAADAALAEIGQSIGAGDEAATQAVVEALRLPPGFVPYTD